MSSMYRSVHPAKPVLVHRDGLWLNEVLEAWWRDEMGWLGYVGSYATP
jgi:hypothetical protein